MLQPGTLYCVVHHDAGPLLIVGPLGYVRTTPHQIIVLVTLCAPCEEDVGAFDTLTQQLRMSKSAQTLRVRAAAGGALRWDEDCPPGHPIATTRFRAAALPPQGEMAPLTPAHAQYRMAYAHHCRALARYAEYPALATGLRPSVLQSALSWLAMPAYLAPPRRHSDAQGGSVAP
jgi:hypothetical protein